ncbi:hypothetical protein DAPPUDRAFT_106601 [Daphnia pulex]|uniref:Uncharacterized protein n=1 Tax=Daphnia pulex TaxID=6669 RepID=E9GU84_DAPPU|nr:hypothetical protein DAPPUDRAFT_106601 [Daphnia pulex]|eukprot:EFX76991.1 hypothetical protein DAPPUDRAFT_106601 [Daphnia pulex]
MTIFSPFRATVYFIMGMILLSCVIQSSSAPAPKGLKKLFEHAAKSHEDPNELKLDDSTKTTHEKPSSVIFRNMMSPRAVKSVFDIAMDKLTILMTGANNFLNGKSNIEPIDQFTSNFNTLFTSPGTSAVNNYYNIFANFWVNFDAISQFIRGLENRIVVRRVTANSAADEEEANAIVEETLLSLTAANAQLEDFKNNLNNLLRRQGIAIVQGTAKSKRADVSMNDSDDEEEDEDQDEEDAVNSLTNQFISPADQINRKYSTAEHNDDNNDIELSTV